MFKLLEKRKNMLLAAEHIVRTTTFAVLGADLVHNDIYYEEDDRLVKWFTTAAELLDEIEARNAFYLFLDETSVNDENAVELEIKRRLETPADFTEKHKDKVAVEAGVADADRITALVKVFAEVLKQEAEIATALIEREKAERAGEAVE